MSEENNEDDWDFDISGKSAEIVYNDIMHPKEDKQRDQFINDALAMFPDPKKPSKINVDIRSIR